MCAYVCDPNQIKSIAEKIKAEYLAKNYPSGLIDKAILLASEYACWMSSILAEEDPDLARRLYPKLFERLFKKVSEPWITRMFM